MIPQRWVNNLIGVFLLVPAWILTKAFFLSFSHPTTRHSFWATEEFWFFGLGAVMWVLMFFGCVWVFGEPRFLRLYVFGHELTHAVWAWAMGGRIRGFKVTRRGGYVVTDKSNFLIALAPYFYPLYSLAVLVGYGLASVFYDLSGFTPVLFAMLGVTWAFHFSFTLWMIPKGQSDLAAHGNFFSLVIIYLANLVLLSLLLIFAAPEITFRGFGRELIGYAEELLAPVWPHIAELFGRRG